MRRPGPIPRPAATLPRFPGTGQGQERHALAAGDQYSHDVRRRRSPGSEDGFFSCERGVTSFAAWAWVAVAAILAAIAVTMGIMMMGERIRAKIPGHDVHACRCRPAGDVLSGGRWRRERITKKATPVTR